MMGLAGAEKLAACTGAIGEQARLEVERYQAHMLVVMKSGKIKSASPPLGQTFVVSREGWKRPKAMTQVV